jgi:hypothetical protein
MGGLPVEMITMLGSSLLGGFMSIWGQSIKAKQEEQKMLLARAESQMSFIEKARTYDNKGFQWTRRIIALTAVFFIIAWPKLVPVLFNTPVILTWTESDGTRGGFATIGYGHKITPDDNYKIGTMYSESDLENQLIKDYISKRNIIRNSIINSGKNPDDIPENVKSILIRNSFWGVSKSSFPMYFDSMLNQEYKNAADNLKFTDPNKGDSGGYTNIYSNKDLRPRTEKVMEEIVNLFNN